MSSICIPSADRNALLGHFRRSADPDVRLHAHVLLLLDAGHPWTTIAAVLFCSFSTISRWKRRYEREGVDTILGRPRGRPRSDVHVWASLVVRWVLTVSPTQFRFARSRWSCEAAAVILREDYRIRVGRETVRRWQHDAGLVWRRPRPTIRPKDPDREAKLRALRGLLERSCHPTTSGLSWSSSDVANGPMSRAGSTPPGGRRRLRSRFRTSTGRRRTGCWPAGPVCFSVAPASVPSRTIPPRRSSCEPPPLRGQQKARQSCRAFSFTRHVSPLSNAAVTRVACPLSSLAPKMPRPPF